MFGGPIFPFPRHGPVGELQARSGPGEIFVVFYRDSRDALSRPDGRPRLKGINEQVETHGAVTVLLIQHPSPKLRAGVQACAFGPG